MNPNAPWRQWYSYERWRRRRRMQLRDEPLCRMCRERGIAVAARIADHIESHRGDWNEFWTSELQSLCVNCHNSRKALVAHRGYDPEIGVDGWPLDQRHPVYQMNTRTGG
jgi:5-methylcytosine-specific restriction endonuclease McrA